MMLLYLADCLLFAVGIVLAFGLTPARVESDLERLVARPRSLGERIRAAKGKRRVGRLGATLRQTRDALTATGKGGAFAVACALSLVLFFVGGVIALVIGNAFIAPVLAVGFALIPFGFALRTVSLYRQKLREELETALSVMTTSYLRTDDLTAAVRENLPHLKPPVRAVFAAFVTETSCVSASVTGAIRNLAEKIDNSVFREWCQTLIACQNDRTLKDTLMPTVEKLGDIRRVQGEVKGILFAARMEYLMMTCMVVGNLPLLYLLNKDWYAALMHTVPGKITLAVCGAAILITGLRMLKITKPMEYGR